MIRLLRTVLMTSMFLALAALACAAPTLVPTAVPLPSPTPTWTLLPAVTPTVEAPTSTPPPTAAPTATQPAATSAPATDTPEPFVCPGAPAPRVQVGDLARVTFTDGLPLRVRESPVVGNNVIAQIPEGSEFTIIDGPRCAPVPNTSNAFVFWQIEVASSGLTGWVAEGDLSAYFIEPID